MTKKTTAGTRQLNVEIAEAMRDRLDKRRAAEARSLRTVVERALAFYMDNVPVESAPSIAAPEQSQPERPRKKK